MLVCFGETMLRLSPPDRLRIPQTNSFDIAYGGADILNDKRLSQLCGFDAELKFINGSAVVLPREQFGAQK